MSTRSLRRLAVLVFALSSARVAAAHDTWLLPERFVLPKAKTTVCEMTSGMRFPRLDSAIERSRVERADFRLGGTVTALEEQRSETKALAFLVPLRATGLAAVVISLKPRTLELTPVQVREYLAEIGAPDAVRAAWQASPGKVWRETYRKHVKTFVRVGSGDDASFAEPTGLPLELVPATDPTRLAGGGELVVRLLQDGRPLGGRAVGTLREGEKAGVLGTTDVDGRVTVRFPRRGRYLLRATEIAAAAPGGETWRSDFTTLTVEVR